MGALKKFINELGKHKLLIYFVIFWGAYLLLWGLFARVEYGFSFGDLIEIFDTTAHLAELLAGALLVIFGIGLLKPDIVKKLNNEKLLGCFIGVWALSFIFFGLAFMLYHGQAISEYPIHLTAVLASIAQFFAGVVLAIFSLKILTETEQETK